MVKSPKRYQAIRNPNITLINTKILLSLCIRILIIPLRKEVIAAQKATIMGIDM